MSEEITTAEGQKALETRIGEVIEDLDGRIHGAWMLSNEYPTHNLLVGHPDNMFKQLIDKATVMAFVGKDYEAAHRANAANAYMEKVPATIAARSQSKEAQASYLLCDTAASVIYATMVTLARYGVTLDELAESIDKLIAAEGLPSGEELAPGKKISK